MLLDLLVIVAAAALVGAAGYLLGRRRRVLGLVWAAVFTTLLVWQLDALANSPAVLMALAPGTAVVMYALAAGYLAALALTLWPVVRRRRAAG